MSRGKQVGLVEGLGRVRMGTYAACVVMHGVVVQITVLLSVNHLSLHLVVCAHVSALLFILEVLFDLLHGKVLSSLPETVFI